MFEPYNASVVAAQKEMILQGFPHDIHTTTKESLITRGRDVIAHGFLESPYECLLFVDADIEFQPADIALLWNLCFPDGGDADVAVGPYRNKNAAARRTAWVNGELREVSDFKEPFEVDLAGTGFMMIRRRTFEALMEAHPDWSYEEGMPMETWAGERATIWGFFQDPIATWHDGTRYKDSEDYFFCKSVRDLGMKVIMHPEIHLKHWGLAAY